jgi:hypothetical protein
MTYLFQTNTVLHRATTTTGSLVVQEGCPGHVVVIFTRLRGCYLRVVLRGRGIAWCCMAVVFAWHCAAVVFVRRCTAVVFAASHGGRLRTVSGAHRLQAVWSGGRCSAAW